MSHHLNDLLENLRTQVARMTTLVMQVVDQACQAVFTADSNLAQETIRLDQRIDDEEVRVEQSAIDLLALQQPAAVDLRIVTTIIKVNADFEALPIAPSTSPSRSCPFPISPITNPPAI